MQEVKEIKNLRYAIQHVNYGAEDDTPSSRLRIEFESPTYAIAKKALGIIAAKGGYKVSRLVLCHLTPLLDAASVPPPPTTTVEKGEALVSQFNVSRKRMHTVEMFKGAKAKVASLISLEGGKYTGDVCVTTGNAFLEIRMKTVRRVIHYAEINQERRKIRDSLTYRYRIILEARTITGDKIWIDSKGIRLDDKLCEAMREGLIGLTEKKVTDCPHCRQIIYTDDLNKDKSDSRAEQIDCYACGETFWMLRRLT